MTTEQELIIVKMFLILVVFIILWFIYFWGWNNGRKHTLENELDKGLKNDN